MQKSSIADRPACGLPPARDEVLSFAPPAPLDVSHASKPPALASRPVQPERPALATSASPLDAALAILALEDGRVFRGRSVGARGEAVGEVVFNTGMTGYQEVLSDPSYAGQIICFTYPLIGNVGVNAVDDEAPTPRCQGVILRQLSPRASNHRARGTLAEWLRRHDLVAVAGVDTRALTRHIRDAGALRGVIATTDAPTASGHDIARLVAMAQRHPPLEGRDLTAGVSTREVYRFTPVDGRVTGGDPFAGGDGPRVLVLDFGVKRGILECLVAAGARVVVAPGHTDAATIHALRPDGVLVSNGPGDPAAVRHGIATVREIIGAWPVLGICLGHQLLALALGLATRKLPFGHHGANHPVRDSATGRVLVTTQNHGFAVDRVPRDGEIVVTHTSLYDGTIEGLAVPERRARSIQFHPEASPGPHDARSIIDAFVHELGSSSPSLRAPRDLRTCHDVAISSAS